MLKASSAALTLPARGHAQVVLCRNKKEPSKYAALKVVFLQSPQVVDDPEHLAIMKQCDQAQLVVAMRAVVLPGCTQSEGGPDISPWYPLPTSTLQEHAEHHRLHV